MSKPIETGGSAATPFIRIETNPEADALIPRFLTAKDGARIRIATRAAPKDRPARGTLIVHPGWAEFLEKYAEVAADLHARGFNVVLLDPRGQGYSQRPERGDNRGLMDDFGKFVDDLGVVVAETKTLFPGPYGILAHSMGGLITLRWRTGPGADEDIAAIVLSAPMTRILKGPVMRFIARRVAALAWAMGQGKRRLFGLPEHSMEFETNTLTQDYRRHERFRQLQLAAPEATSGLPRFAWLRAAFIMMGDMNKPRALERLTPKTLLVSAMRDDTVDATHHRIVAARSPAIELVEIEGARHELLMEKDEYREPFFAAFDRYMDDHMPKPAVN